MAHYFVIWHRLVLQLVFSFHWMCRITTFVATVYSCCVNEVDALREFAADAIIHYGHSCLSPSPGRLPCRFVFGRQRIDVESCVTEVTRLIPDHSRPVLLLYDPVYHWAIGE